MGKTTVAVNVAIALARLGIESALLDADVYGPNVPLMMGINQTPMALGDKIQPITNYGVKLMPTRWRSSILATSRWSWRGPMLHSVIQQFLRGEWIGENSIT